MGGAKKIFKSIGKLFGGDSVKAPETPNYEAVRKQAEEEALRKRSHLASKGMSGTVLGGGYGDDGKVQKKKLLGE